MQQKPATKSSPFKCLFYTALFIALLSVAIPVIVSYIICRVAQRTPMYQAMSNTTVAKGHVQLTPYNNETIGTF